MPVTIDPFIRQLKAAGHSRGVTVKPWPQSSRGSQNIVVIEGPRGAALAYIKARGSKKGFWGLTPNQIRLLGTSRLPRFVILLKMDTESGYVLDVNATLTGVDVWKIGHDGDYKLNERADVGTLAIEQPFAAIQEGLFELVGAAS